MYIPNVSYFPAFRERKHHSLKSYRMFILPVQDFVTCQTDDYTLYRSCKNESKTMVNIDSFKWYYTESREWQSNGMTNQMHSQSTSSMIMFYDSGMPFSSIQHIENLYMVMCPSRRRTWFKIPRDCSWDQHWWKQQ